MTAAEILRARAALYAMRAASLPYWKAGDYQWIASELRRVAGLVVASDEWHERWMVAV